ncbi:MAG: hypothetical protein LBF16_15725 [Pseudomonadales bacterium]|nr:hypothetical protein [Pseudomonadales bacterium]
MKKMMMKKVLLMLAFAGGICQQNQASAGERFIARAYGKIFNNTVTTGSYPNTTTTTTTYIPVISASSVSCGMYSSSGINLLISGVDSNAAFLMAAEIIAAVKNEFPIEIISTSGGSTCQVTDYRIHVR